MGIAYTVRAEFPDERTCEDYLAWLEDGHVDRVISCGAHSAMIVVPDRPDGDPAAAIAVEVRYVFPTREVFDRYVEEFAPALRAEGLRRFPASVGIVFARSVGRIV